MARAIASQTVYVVDDDDGVRSAIARLLRSAGIEARCYGSAEPFLAEVADVANTCILLDIGMPKTTGAEVQTILNQRGIRLPVIALSANDNPDSRIRAQALGARLLLRKPVDDQALLDAIHWVTQPVQRA